MVIVTNLLLIESKTEAAHSESLRENLIKTGLTAQGPYDISFPLPHLEYFSKSLHPVYPKGPVCQKHLNDFKPSPIFHKADNTSLFESNCKVVLELTPN